MIPHHHCPAGFMPERHLAPESLGHLFGGLVCRDSLLADVFKPLWLNTRGWKVLLGGAGAQDEGQQAGCNR
ncbi:hypothetical protein DC3_46200 [Deinococcus cellulosilyticus NBRC 106333 = KACC 11606]|uniref:Uncharacterized protein n=1 Tax=Deinococcus cellulosilyticus (strain DSM 18568 / NBRC 106333 / KACC 11606 / 5516J-15) TaxID=1223518 RepID=A0A511N821_DEIC1|nr:hypothetical protein DC3_46200 [Deinococcus cellulosilyticus NBRC 106333 = KACC 11606]